MSNTTTEIIEKLKSITLLEATELVTQIEETFGVEAQSIKTVPTVKGPAKNEEEKIIKEQPTVFELILQDMPPEEERSKRLTVFRIIRELTSLGLKESKELTNSLPKTLKESISKEEAEEAKKQLEMAGAKIVIR